MGILLIAISFCLFVLFVDYIISNLEPRPKKAKSVAQKANSINSIEFNKALHAAYIELDEIDKIMYDRADEVALVVNRNNANIIGPFGNLSSAWRLELLDSIKDLPATKDEMYEQNKSNSPGKIRYADYIAGCTTIAICNDRLDLLAAKRKILLKRIEKVRSGVPNPNLNLLVQLNVELSSLDSTVRAIKIIKRNLMEAEFQMKCLSDSSVEWYGKSN